MASDALLAALDTRDIPQIQKAMADFADTVQGVQLQSIAFELLGRVHSAKEAELERLIQEMRQLATRRRTSLPIDLRKDLEFERRRAGLRAVEPAARSTLPVNQQAEDRRAKLRAVPGAAQEASSEAAANDGPQLVRRSSKRVAELPPMEYFKKRRSSTDGLTGALAGLDAGLDRQAGEEKEEAEEAEDADEAEADPLADGKRWRGKPGKPGATRKPAAVERSEADDDAAAAAGPLADGARWRGKPGKPGSTRKPGAGAVDRMEVGDDDDDPLADGARWRGKPNRPGATRKPAAPPDMAALDTLEDGARWRDAPGKPRTTRKPGV